MQPHPFHALLTAPAERPRRAASICIAELDGTERLVLHALRAGRPVRDGAAGAGVDADLHAGVDRHEASELRHAVMRYLEAVPVAAGEPAVADDGSLGPLELHTLQALACLQSGLLGEAWRALAAVCGREHAGRALLPLQEVAELLQLRDRRIGRWQFEPSVFRAAGLI